MKKIIYSLLLLSFISTNIFAQKKDLPDNWHMLSLEKDSVYGASVNMAYEFLKDKTPKKEVVVAILDSGADISLEDFQGCLWVNEKEIPNNGKDDDHNGYIDDVHGWNFLGNKNGSMVVKSSFVGDREFMRLKDKYLGKEKKDIKKKDLAEFDYFTKNVYNNSPILKSYKVIKVSKRIVELGHEYGKKIKEALKGQKLTFDNAKELSVSKMGFSKEDLEFVFFVFHMWDIENQTSGKVTWDEFEPKIGYCVESSIQRQESALLGYHTYREQLGDNLQRICDRKYGNNKLYNKGNFHGNHVAGIVGAKRNNGIGIDGIANVKLMIIRVTPNGDEYDKDVALAIRYAAKNGADVINMSFGKHISPKKKWVEKYLKLAEKEDVFVVHASGNEHQCIDTIDMFPDRYVKGKALSNFINVGASGPHAEIPKFSNFGKERVEVFAPGYQINSLYMNGECKKFNGTSMAAPVVSGIVALIKTYYPDLTAVQIKQILMDSVDKIDNKYKFDEKSVTGGIVNAYKAVMRADSISKY